MGRFSVAGKALSSAGWSRSDYRSRTLLFLLVLLLLLLIPSRSASGQPGVRIGYVLSGFMPHQDLYPFLGDDYAPFLGYEIDWVNEGYPAGGIQIGLAYTHGLSKYFAVQPELLFAQRGMHFYAKELYNASYKLNVNYLQFPLLVSVRPAPRWRMRPGLVLGPYASYMLGAKRTLSEWGETDTRSVPGVSDFDLGLVAGFDAAFSTSSGTWTLEFRFEYGLTRAIREPDNFTPLYLDSGRLNNLAFIFLAGFRLR